MNKKIIGAVWFVLLIGIAWHVENNNSSVKTVKENITTSHDDGRVEGYEIYPSEVVDKMKQKIDFVLLDVRTVAEYKELHLENALLLPVQELSQQSLIGIGLGEESKDKEIIVYCRSGSRSKTAYDILTSLGYTNVKSVSGGIIHWQEDNYPFTEAGTYSKEEFEQMSDTLSIETNGPKLTLDRTFHDFGEITQYGGKVETTFTVTNDGDENLKIGTISTSCNCTTASVSVSSLPPKETTTLTVVFDPNLHEEPLDVFKRTVFIPTNDPSNPELEVSVQVDILEGQ